MEKEAYEKVYSTGSNNTNIDRFSRVQHDKKSTMAGQMSLFDLVSDEDRQSFELKYPNVGEYDAEEALAYEKEVLGIYLSGHPLEKYAAALKKNITANAIDFELEEESGAVKIKDNP